MCSVLSALLRRLKRYFNERGLLWWVNSQIQLIEIALILAVLTIYTPFRLSFLVFSFVFSADVNHFLY